MWRKKKKRMWYPGDSKEKKFLYIKNRIKKAMIRTGYLFSNRFPEFEKSCIKMLLQGN